LYGRAVGCDGDDRGHERGGPGVRRDDVGDAHDLEMARRRRFGRIGDTEHAAPARVDGVDEPGGQPRPAVADHEHAVVLVERDAGVYHDAADAGAAVVDAVAVQVLDPALGREHERDLGLAHLPPPAHSTGTGGVPTADVAPVTRVKI